MSPEKLAWVEARHRKAVASLIEQKHKVASCIHWVLISNTALLGSMFFAATRPLILKLQVVDCIFLLVWLGVGNTWMIMLRGCRAYRRMVNLSVVLECLEALILRHTDHGAWRRLVTAIHGLDYHAGSGPLQHVLSRGDVLRRRGFHAEYAVFGCLFLSVWGLATVYDAFSWYALCAPITLMLMIAYQFATRTRDTLFDMRTVAGDLDLSWIDGSRDSAVPASPSSCATSSPSASD